MRWSCCSTGQSSAGSHAISYGGAANVRRRRVVTHIGAGSLPGEGGGLGVRCRGRRRESGTAAIPLRAAPSRAGDRVAVSPPAGPATVVHRAGQASEARPLLDFGCLLLAGRGMGA